jgi:hypothetical protein
MNLHRADPMVAEVDDLPRRQRCPMIVRDALRADVRRQHRRLISWPRSTGWTRAAAGLSLLALTVWMATGWPWSLMTGLALIGGVLTSALLDATTGGGARDA